MFRRVHTSKAQKKAAIAGRPKLCVLVGNERRYFSVFSAPGTFMTSVL